MNEPGPVTPLIGRGEVSSFPLALGGGGVGNPEMHPHRVCQRWQRNLSRNRLQLFFATKGQTIKLIPNRKRSRKPIKIRQDWKNWPMCRTRKLTSL